MKDKPRNLMKSFPNTTSVGKKNKVNGKKKRQIKKNASVEALL